MRAKRVYDPPASRDGARILVDRLWPRGIRKDRLAIDRWMREVAPSSELRTWYGHDPDRWEEFRTRYRRELRSGPQGAALRELRELAARRNVTLLTATRDLERSAAAVLVELLG